MAVLFDPFAQAFFGCREIQISNKKFVTHCL
jgi:hypothetical protein